jgi:hypothetical protein
MKLALICMCFTPGLALAQTTLSGHYEYRTDAESLEILGDLVCFYPNAQSAKLLPRPHTKLKSPWFCFNNSGAKALLGIQHRSCGAAGTATVIVSGYKAYLGEGGGFDTAALQSVKSHSNKKIIACK